MIKQASTLMKFISLANSDRLAIIDDEDADLQEGVWKLNKWGYPQDNYGVLLHRAILYRKIGKDPTGIIADHINRDRFDNRRSNIRPANGFQNRWNSKYPRRNIDSGYIGVRPAGLTLWACVIQINGSRIYSTHLTAREAALEYNRLALKHRGEFAVLNEIADDSVP